MIYVDMDGVVANLHDTMSERMFRCSVDQLNVHQTEQLKSLFNNKQEFLHYFPEGAEALFRNLPPFPFNKQLIETISSFEGKYSILSRPSGLDLNGTKRAKIQWVEEHLAFMPPKDVILVHNKCSNGRAARENVLIDDWDLFVDNWREKGGHAIKYVARNFVFAKDVSAFIRNQLQEFFCLQSTLNNIK